MDISDKIKTLRKRRGLTFEAIGKHVGVGKSTVRKWENGDIKNMRRDKIALLAEALGVTPGYLMGWETKESNEVLKSISEQLTAPSRSKEWKALSEGFEKMEQQRYDEFMAIFNMLKATKPEYFNEGDDDNDPES
jgi:transcriptional regulator with XRE-family HTH domain